ncbi:MAG: biotin transporter BioY [Lachnospiraceae bacterium]|jgi:biotin transport system substrate-specific component
MEHTQSTKKNILTTYQLTLIAVMTAITCILGPLSIPLPFSPVPISFTNLAIYFTVFVLGMKLSTVSCVIYLLIGLVGIPVFSGFSGGFAKLAGPTGGYLIGFIFLALIAGFFIERFPGKLNMAVIGMILGMAVCYLFGTVWLSRQLSVNFFAGLSIGVIPYLPGDAIKIIIAALIGPTLRRAVSNLLQ